MKRSIIKLLSDNISGIHYIETIRKVIVYEMYNITSLIYLSTSTSLISTSVIST